MTSAQNHKLRVLSELKLFFEKNNAVWAGFPRLNDEITAFKSTLLAIMVNGQRQNMDTKGIAKQKRKARAAMTGLVVRAARLAQVWATDNKNEKLKAVFNLSKRHLLNGPSSSAKAVANEVAGELAANIAALAPYRLFPADITALNAAINAFSQASASPMAARGRKKTATNSLPALFTRADSSLHLISALIIGEFSESNPELVAHFRKCRKVGKHQVRHTGITLHITNAANAEPLQGAQVAIPEINKTAASNIDGTAQIIRCRSGHYHIQISAPGFHPANLKEKILRGHILRQEIALQPV